jgi:hypothetical protein
MTVGDLDVFGSDAVPSRRAPRSPAASRRHVTGAIAQSCASPVRRPTIGRSWAVDGGEAQGMRRLVSAVLLSLLAAGLVGCGEKPADNAVEATEANMVTIDGLRYRVVLFRQLNPRVAPDDALYAGPPAAPRSGIYAAFLRVCNESAEARTTTGDVHLEDAFGERFAPQPARVPDRFGYRPARLEPGECLPGPDSAAEQSFDGAALVFEVPFESARERPLVLEIGENERKRIQLDV